MSGYSCLKIAGVLPLAFEEYNMFMSSRITLPFFMDSFFFNTDLTKKRILRGRVPAGEPEDFDF